jgi:hypothetical protein
MELEVAYNVNNVAAGTVQWLWRAIYSYFKQSALEVDNKIPQFIR